MATKKCDVPGCGFRADPANLAVWNAHLAGHLSGGGGGGTPPPIHVHRIMEDYDGMSFPVAEARLNALGIAKADITTLPIPHIAPATTVVGQFPAKGMAITGPVQLVYSDGSLAGGGGTPLPTTTQTTIPPLKGLKSLAAVRTELWANDLELDPASMTMTTHDENMPEGVISVSPPEGRSVDVTSKVKVVLNPPAPPTPAPKLKVPRLRGKTEAEAKAKVGTNFDLTVKVAPDHDLAFREGVILTQSPDEGEEVDATDNEIEVTINPPKPADKKKADKEGGAFDTFLRWVVPGYAEEHPKS